MGNEDRGGYFSPEKILETFNPEYLISDSLLKGEKAGRPERTYEGMNLLRNSQGLASTRREDKREDGRTIKEGNKMSGGSRKRSRNVRIVPHQGHDRL